jgi:hypothetical protein
MSKRFLTSWFLIFAAVVAVGPAPGQTGERRLPEPSSASIQRRLALVFGNNAYPGSPLRNAVNDARTVAGALRQIGFDVSQYQDLGRADMERAVRRFTSQIGVGDVALFYYAGHGIQIEAVNYVVPIDFQADDEIGAKERGISIEVVRERMEAAKASLNILVIDACRDNPFRASRTGTRGLAPMEGGQGTVIVLATGPGKTASDNPADSNGLFTKHFAEVMKDPTLRATEVFDQVKARVFTASGGKQRPWVFSDVIGDFYLARPGTSTSTVALIPPSQLFGKPTPVTTSSTAIFEALKIGSKKEFPEPTGATPLKSRDWQGRAPVYSVNLASYQNREEAIASARSWEKRLGVPVIVVTDNAGPLGIWYQVAGGKLGSFEEGLTLFRKWRADGIKGLAFIYFISGDSAAASRGGK